MRLLFCTDPFDPGAPDAEYQVEASAAGAAGFATHLVDFEALQGNDPERSVRRVPPADPPCPALYRGWMMTVDRYARLYAALRSRGVYLLNDPEAYRHCHHLPAAYSLIRPYTPRTVWLEIGPEVDFDRVVALLSGFGDAPLIIKDFVKSQKHYWHEACFIPSASDRGAVERVVRRFVELQGEDLCGGLVFREYEEFEPVGMHPRSGLPLTREYRVFYFDGVPFFTTRYWEEGTYGTIELPFARFQSVAREIRSRFFTMDLALRKDGEWRIVELGDAQVAGLPEHVDRGEFYRALAAVSGNVAWAADSPAT